MPIHHSNPICDVCGHRHAVYHHLECLDCLTTDHNDTKKQCERQETIIGIQIHQYHEICEQLKLAKAVCEALTVERQPCNDIPLKRRRIEATWATHDTYLAAKGDG